MNIEKFWSAVLRQNAEEIRQYFKHDAYINWHCTNEHFTVEEFILANCEYPGEWNGIVERIEQIGGMIITVVKVFSKSEDLSFHDIMICFNKGFIYHKDRNNILSELRHRMPVH